MTSTPKSRRASRKTVKTARLVLAGHRERCRELARLVPGVIVPDDARVSHPDKRGVCRVRVYVEVRP